MGILRPDFAAWSSLTSKPIRFKALQKPGESRFWQPACSFAGRVAVIKKEIRWKEISHGYPKEELAWFERQQEYQGSSGPRRETEVRGTRRQRDQFETSRQSSAGRAVSLNHPISLQLVSVKEGCRPAAFFVFWRLPVDSRVGFIARRFAPCGSVAYADGVTPPLSCLRWVCIVGLCKNVRRVL